MIISSVIECLNFDEPAQAAMVGSLRSRMVCLLFPCNGLLSTTYMPSQLVCMKVGADPGEKINN